MLKSLARLALFAAIPSFASAQSTWYVDVAGTPPGSGTLADPYTSLQFAIDASPVADGDTILIAPGTYFETVDFRGKAVTVDGSGMPNLPILNAGGAASVVTFASGEGPGSALIGFEITGGSGTPVGGQSVGGGIRIANASPVLDQLEIHGNQAFFGGGIAIVGGAPQLSSCLVNDNQAEMGGGLFVESASVLCSAVDFVANRADASNMPGFGGGIYVGINAFAQIQDCEFTGNTAFPSGGGGAIATDSQSIGTEIALSTFVDNAPGTFDNPGTGGAICAGGPLEALDCLFEGNGFNDTRFGGAASGGTYTRCEFRNNLGQFGGACSGVTAIDCQFYENQGCADGSGFGGAASGSTLTGCLLEGNFACGDGGGAFQSTLVECQVRFNLASGTTSLPGRGGGIHGGSATRTLIHGNRSVANINLSSVGGGASGCDLFDCTVTSNGADEGGGIHESELTGGLLEGNYAHSGGGAAFSTVDDADVRFNLASGEPPALAGKGGGLLSTFARRSRIHGNRAAPAPSGATVPSTGGGASSSTLQDCTVTSNWAEEGGGIHASFTARASVVGNSANAFGGVFGGTHDSSLVWHNQPALISGFTVFQYCNLESGQGGATNISADPLLFGPTGSDVHLMAGSPCIDAGNPSMSDSDGSPLDIGAFPFDSAWTFTGGTYCQPSDVGSLAGPCVPQMAIEGQAGFQDPAPVVLSASAVAPGEFALLFHGRAGAFLPFDPSNGGFLCVGAPLVRESVVMSTPGDDPCSGTLTQAISDTRLLRLGYAPGDRLHAQFWYRMGSGQARLTDAAELLVLP